MPKIRPCLVRPWRSMTCVVCAANSNHRARRAAAAMMGSFNHGEHRDHRGRVGGCVCVAHDMQGEAAIIECLRLFPACSLCSLWLNAFPCLSGSYALPIFFVAGLIPASVLLRASPELLQSDVAWLAGSRLRGGGNPGAAGHGQGVAFGSVANRRPRVFSVRWRSARSVPSRPLIESTA